MTNTFRKINEKLLHHEDESGINHAIDNHPLVKSVRLPKVLLLTKMRSQLDIKLPATV
ncbi:hypothetical protein [uncultured Nostoc sp.]|uniref:hypothetical protein n=1 Tax=uncultured Nostoc sp. TaxID=340711 RepID=UPI0035C9BECA